MARPRWICNCGHSSSYWQSKCGECGYPEAKNKEQQKHQPASEAVSTDLALLSCADLAKAMNDNKKQIVIMDESHNVRELDVAKYGINDNVILVYVKRVEI